MIVPRPTEDEQYLSLLQKNVHDPCVFLETRNTDPNNHLSYYFYQPERSISFNKQDSISDFFGKIEEAQNQGYWLAGYFCYEMGYFFEPHLYKIGQNLNIDHPLAWFGVFNSPFVLDANQINQNTQFKTHPFLKADGEPVEIDNLQINMTRKEYYQTISEIMSHLKEGNTYQVNLTLKYLFSINKSPFKLFRYLQLKQNVAYSAYLYNGHHFFLSLSPELFFKRDNTRITSKPMKGTVERGRFNVEDVGNAVWLKNDPKNLAENTMIVDLVRNDLGKISSTGSVHVTDPYQVEKFSTLHQMTSTVKSKLRPNISNEDLFRAMFPFGSITGAPKISTMEIIHDLEKEPRGIYTGAIGYFSPDGSSQFNVAIRTLAIDKNGNGQMGIGGGIVAESTANAEFDECLLKGEFLTRGLEVFSLIETMRLEDGKIYLFDHHMKRLQDSADYFDINCPLKNIKADLYNLSNRRTTRKYKIRLLLDQHGEYQILTNQIEKPPKKHLFKLKISKQRVHSENRWLYHKTTNRNLYDSERKLALEEGFDEVIFLNEKEEVSEGAISNIFIKESDQLHTPSQKTGLLNGTLRQSFLENNKCQETIIKKQDLLDADQIFIGNSVMGLVKSELLQV